MAPSARVEQSDGGYGSLNVESSLDAAWSKKENPHCETFNSYTVFIPQLRRASLPLRLCAALPSPLLRASAVSLQSLLRQTRRGRSVPPWDCWRRWASRHYPALRWRPGEKKALLWLEALKGMAENNNGRCFSKVKKTIIPPPPPSRMTHLSQQQGWTCLGLEHLALHWMLEILQQKAF